MAEYYIDAKDAILGRMASYVAKKALGGDKIYVLNAEKAVITGSKEEIFRRYWLLRSDIGGFKKGPHFPKMPHFFVKRVIRGMLPHKKMKGRDIRSNVVVHIGIPKEFKDKELKSVHKIDEEKTIKFIKVGDLSKHLGWKGE